VATKASKFVFEGDGEEVVEFKQDAADEERSEDDEGQGLVEGDEDAPEDDFNAAWEVLDLARALYEKQGDSDEAKLKVADTYIALGDVSLETGAPLFFF
jgi:HAT1-interacting factor 1